MSAFSNNSRNSRGRSNGGASGGSSRRKPRIDSSRRPKPFRPKSGGSKELRAAANSVFATASTGKPPRKTSGANAANDDSPVLGRRLQQVLAAAGYGSRRQCEDLIRDGRVEVDGEIVSELGVRVSTGEQKIRVDGEALPKTKPTYVALNKPKNALCTNNDPQGRRRVGDFIPTQFGRLFPVGRLDQNSEGLILLTNDGALAERLTHPRFEVPKKYRVQVAGLVDFELVRDLKRGVHIAEGIVQADDVVIKSQHKLSSVLEITLKEGKNREIRRMLARLGHKVMQLQRVQVGPIKLGKMAPGEFRLLTSQEVASLYRSSQTGVAASRRQDADESDGFQRPAPVEISEIVRRQELEEEERAAKKSGKGVSSVGKSTNKNDGKLGGARTCFQASRPTRGFSSEKRREIGDSSTDRSYRSEYSTDRSERPRRDARPEFREEFRSEERRDDRRRVRREYDDETRTIGPRKFDRSESSDRRDRFNADATAKRTPREFGGRPNGNSDSNRNSRQNSRPGNRPSSSRPAPRGGSKNGGSRGGSRGLGGGNRSRGK